jgi:hypothetical protein
MIIYKIVLFCRERVLKLNFVVLLVLDFPRGMKLNEGIIV